MTASTIIVGNASRVFNELAKINTNGNIWIPQEDASIYVKKESIKITKNGIYVAPKGTLYNNITVKVKRKDRASSSSSAPTDTSAEEKNYESRTVSVRQIREPQTYHGVEKITTVGANSSTITWVPESDACYYVNSETITIEDNGTYHAEEGKLYSKIIVHVTKDSDDENEDIKLITKEITANGTYNAADDGVKGYSSVIVNVSGAKKTGITKCIYESGIYAPEGDRYYNRVIVARNNLMINAIHDKPSFIGNACDFILQHIGGSYTRGLSRDMLYEKLYSVDNVEENAFRNVLVMAYVINFIYYLDIQMAIMPLQTSLPCIFCGMPQKLSVERKIGNQTRQVNINAVTLLPNIHFDYITEYLSGGRRVVEVWDRKDEWNKELGSRGFTPYKLTHYGNPIIDWWKLDEKFSYGGVGSIVYSKSGNGDGRWDVDNVSNYNTAIDFPILGRIDNGEAYRDDRTNSFAFGNIAA